MSSATAHRLRNLAMGIGVLALAALFTLLGWSVRHSGDAGREALPSPLIGQPAPQLDLALLDNPQQRLKTSDLRGAPFVLNVWGSWCVECRIEQPTLLQLAQSRRVALIGYDLKDAPADARQWLAQNGNPYRTIGSDVEGRSALDWGIYGAPETFLVDANGIVRWKHVGPLGDAIVHDELLPQLEKLR